MSDTPPSKKSLIDELHSIKELLEKEQKSLGNEESHSLSEIPVLSNPLPKADMEQQAYLSADQFDEKNSVESAQYSEEYSIEFMIQELVDEMIPDIEAQLRKKLSALSPAILEELYKNTQP